MSRRIAAGMLAGALAVAAGCQSKSAMNTPGQRAPAPKVTAADVARLSDPVAASQLRERAFDMLMLMAHDPLPQVRANALEALAESPQRLRPLAAAALNDENAGVRSTAAMMIGRAKLVDLAPATRPLLTDPSPFVRASTIYALAKCGLEVDVTPLAPMVLGDPSAQLRSHAAFLLGELGDPSAAGLLREAARSRPAQAKPAESRLLQIQIAEALYKLGDTSQAEPIRAALYPSTATDLEATALAAQVLGNIRDKSSTDELVYLTAYRDKQKNRMPAEIRLAAAASLAKLGLDKGSFVADEYSGIGLDAVRAQAAFVYGEIGRKENLPKLEKMMADRAGIVRVAAAGAVLKVKDTGVAAVP